MNLLSVSRCLLSALCSQLYFFLFFLLFCFVHCFEWKLKRNRDKINFNLDADLDREGSTAFNKRITISTDGTGAQSYVISSFASSANSENGWSGWCTGRRIDIRSRLNSRDNPIKKQRRSKWLYGSQHDIQRQRHKLRYMGRRTSDLNKLGSYGMFMLRALRVALDKWVTKEIAGTKVNCAVVLL